MAMVARRGDEAAAARWSKLAPCHQVIGGGSRSFQIDPLIAIDWKQRVVDRRERGGI